MERGSLILVLGGARSGKSALAEKLAASSNDVVYVATAYVKDEEMVKRVEKHQSRRPSGWRTVEAPIDLVDTVATEGSKADTLLIDSLGMWLSNLLEHHLSGKELNYDENELMMEKILLKVKELALMANKVKSRVILVTDEVGMGLIPPYPLGRMYRDLLGSANQEMARFADNVYFVVAGLPITLKGSILEE
ncbi:MAG: adenosylcobinamide kinase / adenosylcobinamide-phosphate guanylyltransferase [Clostridia bacterium]|nr:adenosylcobinamide kinase / adenosylcobinamide-phosphate guanylyltransferase [Clostridia bacterium]